MMNFLLSKKLGTIEKYYIAFPACSSEKVADKCNAPVYFFTEQSFLLTQMYQTVFRGEIKKKKCDL